MSSWIDISRIVDGAIWTRLTFIIGDRRIFSKFFSRTRIIEVIVPVTENIDIEHTANETITDLYLPIKLHHFDFIEKPIFWQFSTFHVRTAWNLELCLFIVRTYVERRKLSKYKFLDKIKMKFDQLV